MNGNGTTTIMIWINAVLTILVMSSVAGLNTMGIQSQVQKSNQENFSKNLIFLATLSGDFLAGWIARFNKQRGPRMNVTSGRKIRKSFLDFPSNFTLKG